MAPSDQSRIGRTSVLLASCPTVVRSSSPPRYHNRRLRRRPKVAPWMTYGGKTSLTARRDKCPPGGWIRRLFAELNCHIGQDTTARCGAARHHTVRCITQMHRTTTVPTVSCHVVGSHKDRRHARDVVGRRCPRRIVPTLRLAVLPILATVSPISWSLRARREVMETFCEPT